MGHDIYGFNNEGQEISYARFSMRNYNALILYRLLNSYKYYAGVSGSGRSKTFSSQQIEKALQDYRHLYQHGNSPAGSDALDWDQKQILVFIENCLETAQREGRVRVYFG